MLNVDAVTGKGTEEVDDVGQLDTFSDSIMAHHLVSKRCLLVDIPDTASLVYPVMYLPPSLQPLGKYPLLSLQLFDFNLRC